MPAEAIIRLSPVPSNADPIRPDDPLSLERLIDRAEYQTLLGVGQSTFERLKAAGKLAPHIKLGHTLHRWRLGTVLDWLREQEECR